MSKLHYCSNGVSVTDQVIEYQKTHANDDYIPIQEHYDSYKDVWFRQLSDYMDRESFESEFEYKLIRAVDTFDEKEARSLAKKFNWPLLGMFNRWFYRILSNWKSNVKNSSFRAKKRPPILCPVCGRWVPRIDVDHLQHYKTIKDLPRFTEYDGKIWSVYMKPLRKATSFGEYDKRKLTKMNQGHANEFIPDRFRGNDWPWHLPDGNPGVLCPLTKKVVPNLDDEYLQSLPARVNRYAEAMTWEEFIETYPNSLIESVVWSLDAPCGDEDSHLSDLVGRDKRKQPGAIDTNLEEIRKNRVSVKYENAFFFIDENVEDTVDREMLKLFAVGYSLDDVASSLCIAKADVKRRLKVIKSVAKDLEKRLLETV
jgi:hypothetical protein